MSSDHPRPDMRMHHVGIAAKSIEKARRFVESTFDIVSATDVIHDPIQDADLCLLTDRHGDNIELVAGAAVEGLLRKGHTYYHCCYETDDLDAALAHLRRNGCMPVRPPSPAVLFGGRRVAFVLSPLGLIELLEAQS